MKYLLSMIFAILLSTSLLAQYSVNTNLDTPGDFTCYITSGLDRADINVAVSHDNAEATITVAFTNDPGAADIVMTNETDYTDVIIGASSKSNADLLLNVSNSVENSDLSISLIKKGLVDYLIYHPNGSTDINSVVTAMLPIINSKMGHKFDAIPFWGTDKEYSIKAKVADAE